MPSTSKKQHNLMEAVAHNSSFAKKVGIPQSVGKDFSNADKGKKFSKGGDTMATDPRKLAAMMAMKKAQMAQAQQAPAAPAMGGMGGMKKGGATKKMAAGGKAETMGPRTMKEDVEKGSNKDKKFGEHGVQKRGHTKDIEEKMKGSTTGMKKGGMTKKYAKGGTIIGESQGSEGLKRGNKGFGQHAIQKKGMTKGKYI
jgi:hypothetical protein